MSSSGCSWQNKSFSVAVTEDKPLDICQCGNLITEVIYKYNGEILCRDCYSKKEPLRKKLGISDFGFNTTKDKLYEFVDNRNFRQSTEVRSKRHWQKLLKQHGLIDDIKGVKENLPEKIDKKFIAHEINRELQEKGLRDKLLKRR